MTNPIDRAEISRRNARKSTGPRTPEGKARSRFNAVKHGCRATQLILPGEDPEVYQARLDAWADKFAPRDAVEFYLVERAVHVSWQLDRADRAEDARLAEDLDREAARRVKEADDLGDDLFRIPAGRLGAEGEFRPVPDDDVPTDLLSWPFDPEHYRHPSHLVAKLETTAAGCDWLRNRWAALAKVLDEGGHWRPVDRLHAVRMLGQQPLDLIADRQVLAIYLAGRTMDPKGADVFAEPLGDLYRPESSAQRERLSQRFAAEKGPRNAREARASLMAIVTAAMARVEALREVHTKTDAAGRSDILARMSYEAKVSVEWLHKHQVTCNRTLFRTFEELRKIRRDSENDPPNRDENDGPPASGPPEGGTPTGPLPGSLLEYRLQPESGDQKIPPKGGTPTGPLPGSLLEYRLQPESGWEKIPPEGGTPTGPSPAPGLESLLEYRLQPESVRAEIESAPASIPGGSDELEPTATNEASRPADRGTNEASRPADRGTNEASRPAATVIRAVSFTIATALALLLGSAAFGATGSGVGPDPLARPTEFLLDRPQPSARSSPTSAEDRLLAPGGGRWRLLRKRLGHAT